MLRSVVCYLILGGLPLISTAASPRASPTAADAAEATDWPNYGNDPGGMRYSLLKQINRKNVGALKPAWTFHTGDISDGKNKPRSGFETTPIFIAGVLYLTTPFNRVIALEPSTGRQLWAFDPKIDQSWESGDGLVNRGLASWLDEARGESMPCRRRLFEATIDARLIAVDAATGRACADFGQNGQVSLRDVPGFHPGWYHMTSPPAGVDDVVVVGSAIDDNTRVDMPSGVVRAFDARSGALRWSWDPIAGGGGSAGANAKTFQSGAANAWSVMAVDPKRHLLFVPTGSASPDYFGGLRPGDDKWANSVVALRSATGEVAWGFQLVHHDLWDYDVAVPPLLATLTHEGIQVPVVIAGDKSGYLYVLNRDTGKPVFEVREQPVPKSDIPEEAASPTQPIPVAPPPLAPQKAIPWGRTPEETEACRKQLESLHAQGIFTPPSTQGVIAAPGNVGGMNWSGYALDPTRGLLIVNVNNIPFEVRLIPRAETGSGTKGAQQERLSAHGEFGSQTGTPYRMFRRPLFSAKNLPCVPPPWGTLAAVDMNRGTIRWQVPLGVFNLAGPDGPRGTLSLGGPIVTAGDVAFIAGTFLDPHIRAFDVETGKELWSAELPAPGHATPMTYQYRGKQYVVIAAGGHSKLSEEKQSDSLVAFALP